MFGEGPSNPIGVLVGEAPGRDDAEVGRPFTGMSGRQLNEELMLAGLLREKLFVVLACACRSKDKPSPADQRKAALACRSLLLSQLSKFPTQVPVFAMGKYALIGLNGVDMPGGVKNARGFVRKDWKIGQQNKLARVLSDDGEDSGDEGDLPEG